MRIASLIPSGTDIAAALGLAPRLVGVSHACDHPAARGLPILTRSVIPPDLPPAEIDACVSAALRDGEANGSLYRTDRELLRRLAPDVILTQTICDVCAVNARSVARDLPPGAQLIELSATNIAGLWDDLRHVAQATGADQSTLMADLQARLRAVESAVSGKSRPRVLVLEWTEPPFLGGHWVPEIIARAGGQHVLFGADAPSRRATWEEIAASDPDVLLLAPCGYYLDQTMQQGCALLSHPMFGSLRAVREGHAWATNATHLFSRCTPETVQAVEVVAGILHPDQWPAPAPSAAVRLPR